MSSQGDKRREPASSSPGRAEFPSDVGHIDLAREIRLITDAVITAKGHFSHAE
jgi:hypothetical protein